jgi:hypothetical protein
MDFTAYYTAGNALNHNLSPYVNHISKDWNLWDGFDSFKHSRFLYPPLVANLFQPIAKLSYIDAKHFWNIFNLCCFLICFIILLKIFKYDKDLKKILISGILCFNFFPFVALLERGQIDCVTLLFLLLGLMIYLKDKNEYLTGIFWSIATLFKLYTILVIPFLILRKQYKILFGYLSGIFIIVVITLVLNGFDNTYNYVFKEAPRIAQYGSSGTDEMKIPVWILQAYFPMSPTSVSIIQNRMYVTESISFNSKASFIRFFEVGLNKLHLNLPNSIISLIIFSIFFNLILLFYKKYLKELNNFRDIIFWQIIFIIILLSSPYTWVMNLIWMLPVAFILIKIVPELVQQKRYAYILIFIIGYLLLALPDNLHWTKNLIFIHNIFASRFVISEFVILMCLLNFFKTKIKLHGDI